jgi:hypothetical protein
LKVIVPVADKYRHIMPIFSTLFNKYWPNQEVIVLCFTELSDELPDNFQVISLGEDTGSWTRNLRDFFKNYPEDYFALHLEDHILTEPVKLDRLAVMEEEMRRGADKAMLHSHLNPYAEPLHDDVLVLRQDAPYRRTIHTALWNTSYFLECLELDLSVWGFESNPGAVNDGAKIVTLYSENTYHDHIVNFMNLLRSKKIDTSITGLWDESDLNVLLSLDLEESEKQVLVRRTSNVCPSCNSKVDRMLIKTQPIMQEYEINGTCFPCQMKANG